MPVSERYRDRQARLHERGIVLVSSLPDIRWLTGFTGSNALVVCADNELHVYTDGRYADQVAEEVTADRVQIVSGSLLESLGGLNGEEILFQSDVLTVQQLDELKKCVSGAVLRGIAGLLREARAAKDENELSLMQRALDISEAVFRELPGVIQEGMTEMDLAAEIDWRQRKRGASRSSFETIVAFGANSALPHARPGTTRLAPHEPILMDFGCVVDGYCSDMTRMAVLGKPSHSFRTAHALVDRARQAAIHGAHAGMALNELDAVARDVIAAAGHGPAFSHSLGHGLGLEVHEWPAVSFRSSDALPDRAVVTIEPGVYFRSEFGVRLEDTVYLQGDRVLRLNSLSTELVII